MVQRLSSESQTQEPKTPVKFVVPKLWQEFRGFGSQARVRELEPVAAIHESEPATFVREPELSIIREPEPSVVVRVLESVAAVR
ncbi:hypothetical protein V6N13_076614 [Hibiscus sabdariffa]